MQYVAATKRLIEDLAVLGLQHGKGEEPTGLRMPDWLIERIAAELGQAVVAGPPGSIALTIGDTPILRPKRRSADLVLAVVHARSVGSDAWPLIAVHPEVPPDLWPYLQTAIVAGSPWSAARLWSRRLGVTTAAGMLARAFEAEASVEQTLNDNLTRLGAAERRVGEALSRVGALTKAGRPAGSRDLTKLYAALELAASELADVKFETVAAMRAIAEVLEAIRSTPTE